MNVYNTQEIRFPISRRHAEAPERARRSRSRRAQRRAAAVILGSSVLCVLAVAAAVWRTAFGGGEDPAVLRGISRSSGQVVAAGAGDFTDGAQTPDEAAKTALSDYAQLSDPLLVLVNDQVPLPEDWQVTPSFIGDEAVDSRMYGDLDAMFLAAEDDGVSFWVCSGYRSVEDQESILNREIQQHMTQDGMSREDARELSLRTIARPGYSEHHTGLAVDLNDVSDDFEETDAYRWLQEHGAEYGFVQRYRKDKAEITGIENESWHYRYVGAEHAKEMDRLDMCLEEYVEYLKAQGVQ